MFAHVYFKADVYWTAVHRNTMLLTKPLAHVKLFDRTDKRNSLDLSLKAA